MWAPDGWDGAATRIQHKPIPGPAGAHKRRRYTAAAVTPSSPTPIGDPQAGLSSQSRIDDVLRRAVEERQRVLDDPLVEQVKPFRSHVRYVWGQDHVLAIQQRVVVPKRLLLEHVERRAAQGAPSLGRLPALPRQLSGRGRR